MSDPHSDIGRNRQRAIYVAGAGGHRPAVPVAQTELEKAAQAAMSPGAWAYVAGGAGRESTMDANRAAFDRWSIVPRVLRDVEKRDLSIELFGRKLPSPLLLCPIGVLEMAHREADLAVARAAAAMGVPYIFSNQASVPMENCAAAMGDAPHWFQLYWSKSNELVASFVSRAEACGCSAIVLTLDTTMLGWRPRDLDLGSLPFMQGQGIAQYTSDPVFRKQLAQTLDAGAAAKPLLNLQSIATALTQKANFPGGLLKNLASGIPVRRCSGLPRPTRGLRYSGMISSFCGSTRSCRSCSRACCIPTMRRKPWNSASTGWSCRITADGRSTARSAHSTPCLRWPAP
ncbi:MAG: hypothetical protein EXS42_01875 [Lacunisphaera sp.]|nr:hypothetical protein [Lacunisphaera sp.]